MRRIAATAVAALAAIPGSSALGSPARDSTESATRVTVRLKEFKVIPSVRSVRRGKVTFVARNVGKLPHDFVVLKTNLPPGGLPTRGSRAREIGRVAKIPAFGPRQTRIVRVTLKPGKYVLICNVSGHYKAGMFAGFRAR